MKSNIDLTENQIFTRRINIDGDSIKKLLKFIGHPWDNELHMIASDKEINNRSVVFIGTKEQRKHYKMCDNIVSGDYCDRCGVYLKSKPWTKCFSLCFNCDTELDKELKNKKLWFN